MVAGVTDLATHRREHRLVIAGVTDLAYTCLIDTKSANLELFKIIFSVYIGAAFLVLIWTNFYLNLTRVIGRQVSKRY